MYDGELSPPFDVAALPHWPSPAGPRRPGPPLFNVAEIDRARCLVEDERAWRRTEIVLGIWLALGHSQVARLHYEQGELGVGHLEFVHPETVNGDPVDWTFLLIKVLGPHVKSSTWNPDHVLRC